MKRIDFHTHAFPDALAPRAMSSLKNYSNAGSALDGTIADLRRSMDRAGIDRSVIASIATRPEQFESIFKWSCAVRSNDIEPFLSVHPRDSHIIEHIRLVAAEGFKGIKMHPYYQDFDLDDERLFPVYEAISENRLVLLAHAGFDMAFERIRRCDPVKALTVARRFPELKLVAAHCGAWEDWDEVEARLLGLPICMDTSYSLDFMGEARFARFLNEHPSEYMLFGTDSPWADQAETVAAIERCVSDPVRLERIFFANAERLLDG